MFTIKIKNDLGWTNEEKSYLVINKKGIKKVTFITKRRMIGLDRKNCLVQYVTENSFKVKNLIKF